MKQFIMQNLFIVIAVGLTVLALVTVIVPWMEISQATETATLLSVLHDKLDLAMRKAESPQWVSLSDEGIRQIQEAQERVIETSLLFETREPLLILGRLIFPIPEPEDRFNFRAYYTESLDKWFKDLGVISLPTQEDLADAIKFAKQAADAARPAGGAAGPAPDEKKITEDVRAAKIAERARQGKIWADKAVCFDYYVKTGGSSATPMTDKELWEALVNWWIQKDLVEVIKAVNDDKIRQRMPNGQVKTGLPPSNVQESPIKELAWIDVEEGYYRGAKEGSPANAAALPGALTGHLTCAKYDVIHYSFQVVMDVKDLPLLVGTLSCKNFHTVLSLQYDTLDKKGRPAQSGGSSIAAPTAGEAGPDYGPSPVMVVTLNCEAVFMKSPQSWRENSDQGRRKRQEFLRKNKQLVLAVNRIQPDGKSVPVLAHKDLAANQKKLDQLLGQNDPNLRFIALYEDLMPQVIKNELPGFGAGGTTATGARPAQR